MGNENKARITSGLYLCIIIACALISIWSVFADPIINIDGILYIKSAAALAAGDIDAALGFHKWPFYAYLIGGIHQLSGIDLEISAHILNCLLNILTCVGFVFLICELGATQRTVLIAVLVIVLFPGLNELRSYIIRDHGYIAFYIWSLYFLIRALHIRSQPLLGLSLLSMAVAALFRIEGMVFLIAMPIIYLNSRNDVIPMNRLTFNLLVVVTTILLLSVFGWWLYSPSEQADYSLHSIENISHGWNQAIDYLDNKIDVLKDHILDTSSDTTGRLVYLWTVGGIIFTQVLIILSIPYSYLSAYGLVRNLVFPGKHGVKPWKLFIYFNLIILAVFTLTKFFLTDRYPLALAITLLAIVPFSLAHVYSRWLAKPRTTFKSNLGYILVVLLLLVNVFEGLTSRSDKHYLKDSGIWISENIDAGTSLYTNDLVVGFYSEKAEELLAVEPDRAKLIGSFYRGEWIHFDYLALQVSPDVEFQGHLEKTLWVEPEKVFVNERNREVRIYNIKKYREREDQ